MSTAEEFVQSFSNAIVKRDFPAAEAMLASWLRSVALKKMVRQARGTAPPAFAADPPSLLPFNTPASWGEDEFGPPSAPVPSEITDANFRGSFRVEFVPDPDLEAEVDFSYALFLVVVEWEGKLAIGYIEPAE